MTAWLPSRCRWLYAVLRSIYIKVKDRYMTQGGRSFSQRSRQCSNLHNQLFSRSFLLLLVLIAIASIFIPEIVFANNVAVENVELVDQDEDADTIEIEFDLSWSNAWKDSINNDAVWVFAKYCTSNCTTNGTWSHALLKTAGTNPSGVNDGTKQSGSAFSALDMIVSSDKVGAFIQPSSNGSGTVDFHDVNLVWDYGANGLDDADADASTTYVRVYGIEMTYIPIGSFYIGDGGDGLTNGEFEWENARPCVVTSETPLFFDDSVGAVNACYYNTDLGGSDDRATGYIINLAESFPEGASPFYLMKYEMSQGQYRDFLNSLTQAQQDTRVASTLTNENDANTYVMVAESQATVVNRQTIKAGSNPADGDPYTFTCDLNDNDTGDESADGEWIAMNYLSWMDLAAYADWAGLRPMTETEFERACRGPSYPVSSEMCWGSISITAVTSISNSGAANETAGQSGNGLMVYNNAGGVQGPLRVGFAATGSTTSRASAGAGFYGNTELSGNVWERAVSVGVPEGQGFGGTHGDGILTNSGNANNADWPGFDGSGVSSAAGSGFRGGAWDETTANYHDISNRQIAGTTDSTRRSDSGGRLARTA